MAAEGYSISDSNALRRKIRRYRHVMATRSFGNAVVRIQETYEAPGGQACTDVTRCTGAPIWSADTSNFGAKLLNDVPRTVSGTVVNNNHFGAKFANCAFYCFSNEVFSIVTRNNDREVHLPLPFGSLLKTSWRDGVAPGTKRLNPTSPYNDIQVPVQSASARYLFSPPL